MNVAGEVNIRSGLSADAAPIIELWKISGALPTATDSPEGISYLLDSDKDALIVAEVGDRDRCDDNCCLGRLSILVPEPESAREFWSAMGYLEDVRVARFAKTLSGRDARE